MPDIHIDNDTCDLIDQHRLIYHLRGNPDVSREEMLKLLLEYGSEALTGTPLRRRHEKGLICFGPGGHVELPGVVAWPAPHEAAALLNGEGARLVVVCGRAGSGVSTYIQNVMAEHSGNAEIFDADEGGNPVNIVGAMLAFEQGRSAVLAVTADTHQQALSLISRYSSSKWLKNYDCGRLLHQCDAASVVA